MTATFKTDVDDVSETCGSLENKKDRYLTISHRNDYVNKQIDIKDTSETTKLLMDKGRPEREITKNRNATNQKQQPREATGGRKVFILVACLLLHFIAGGIAVSLGVIYVDLIRVFEAPHSQAALVQSIFMGTMIAGGVIFTGVLQKYGTGLPGIIASFIAALAFLGSSFAPNVPTLIALIGVIGGLSMGVNYLSAFITVGWTFRENSAGPSYDGLDIWTNTFSICVAISLRSVQLERKFCCYKWSYS